MAVSVAREGEFGVVSDARIGAGSQRAKLLRLGLESKVKLRQLVKSSDGLALAVPSNGPDVVFFVGIVTFEGVVFVVVFVSSSDNKAGFKPSFPGVKTGTFLFSNCPASPPPPPSPPPLPPNPNSLPAEGAL